MMADKYPKSVAPSDGQQAEPADELHAPEKPLFRKLAEIAPVLIFIRRGTQFLFVNPIMESISGYAVDELVGMDFRKLVHPDYQELVDEQWLAHTPSEATPARYETKILRKDGKARWLELANSVIDIDGEQGVLGVGFDITERKQAEKKLRQAHEELELQIEERTKELKDQQRDALQLAEEAEEARDNLALANQALKQSNVELQQLADKLEKEKYLFTTLIENIPDAIYFKDRESRFLRISRAQAEKFGISSPDNAIGKTDADIFSTEHAQQALEDEREIMRTGVPVISKAEKETWPDREDTWVSTTKLPLRDKEGEIVGTFGISRDITERKRLEEKQQQLYEELRIANEALEQSNLELQQFAYIASHDLQTPLRSIAAFAQFLQKDYQGQLDEQADDYIERMVEGVKHMQTLITDLLAYSRIESRATPFQAVDLNEVCMNTVNLLRAVIEESSGEVTFEDLPTVKGDSTQLAQLLQNLISNGLKYHGRKPPRVHVTAEQIDQTWTISVKDNGIGISQEFHEKIFEIFRRLHADSEYAGTGIGLAVCRRIVQRHGGRIWVDSEPDQGSTFYFTIPAAI
jgi:PAS domain S-box-containing protein